MGTLKRLIFCTLIIIVKMMITESTVYSSPDTSLKFSQCLIDKISKPPFFTEDDRNSIIAVQDVMAQALHAKDHTLISSRILMTAFITSLADIILIDDAPKTFYRKGAYSSALEQCSISSTGYADSEFIAEAQRILSVIESSKAVKYKEAGTFRGLGIPPAGTFASSSFSQTSNVGSSMAVQPSPVQNPQVPQDFYPNDRTVFEQSKIPNNPPIVSSAQSAFNSQHTIQPSSKIDLSPSFGTGMPVQPGNLPQSSNFPSISQTGDFSSSFILNSQHQNFPVSFDESKTSQSQKENLGPHPGKFPNNYDIVSQSGGSEIPQFEKDFLGPQSGSLPFGYDAGRISETDTGRSDVLSYAEFPQTSPMNAGGISQTSNKGLNIPQTKESSVIVIPPKTNQQFTSYESISQNEQQGADKVAYIPPNQETVAQSEVSDISMTSPAAIIPEQQQYPAAASSPTLENIAFNVLINSPKFRETFNSAISQENAIKLARDITERTFSGYDLNIMNDALSFVTEEVEKVRVPAPETFSFAISNAIVGIVKRHDSYLPVDPSQVASSFLSNLDNTEQFHSQQESVENQPKDYYTDDFSMTSPAATPQEQQQYSDVTSYPTLESIVFNTLTNSPKFRETFNSEISQENAINLARDLIQRTFAGFDSNIMNDALSVVTEEVLKVRVPSPETFAFAISNALVYVMKHYDSSLSTEHSQVATSFLSNLDNPGQFPSQADTVQKQPQDYNPDVTSGQFYTQPETVEKQPQDYDTSLPAYYEFDEKQTDFDFQYPPLSPEDRKNEMFSLSLAQYMTKSEAIRNFYCDENKPEDKVQLSHSIIKASLTEFGQHVATLAASVTSGALSELSKDGLCSNYAKTISEIIAEILEENKIDNANAEDVAKKMEMDLLQRQIPPTESPKHVIIHDNDPQGISKNKSYAVEPELQSSFIPIENINSQYSEKDKYPNLVTSPDSKGASEYEFTYPVSLLHTSIDLSTVRPNINSEDRTPDGIKDQQAFGDYLFQHFHTLESIFSEENDENNNKGNSTTEIIESQESEKEFTDESTVDEFSQIENQKKTISTPKSDTIVTSSDKSEDDTDYNPIITEGGDKLYYQDESEIPQKNIHQSNPPPNNFKTSGVELQPSFQSPTFYSDGSTEKFQQNPGITSYNYNNADKSLAFARQVSKNVESIIGFIRSQDQNFDHGSLCVQINKLAPLVNIPELDKCDPTAALDYLLNVMRVVVKILSGV